jgi:hypothetical protein
LRENTATVVERGKIPDLTLTDFTVTRNEIRISHRQAFRADDHATADVASEPQGQHDQ